MVRWVLALALLLPVGAARAGWDASAKIDVGRVARAAIVLPDRCPHDGQESACAISPEGESPVVYLGAFEQEDNSTLYWTYYHELGHVLDHVVLTDAERATILRLVGTRRSWEAPFASPHQDFADAFATCAVFGPKVGVRLARRMDNADVSGVPFQLDGRDRVVIGNWRLPLRSYRTVCATIISAIGRLP